jgi:hypothetical protein
MKLRQDPVMVTVFTSVCNKLTAMGYQPKHHALDNESSRTVQ